jgi:hypothetical protein
MKVIGGKLPRHRSEPRLQKLIERDDAMPVKNRDEQEAHDDASQHRADGKLRVTPVLPAVTGLGRAEKRRRADLRRQDRRQHRPPGDLAVSQRETLHTAALAALRQADADDDGEVTEDDERVEEVGHGVWREVSPQSTMPVKPSGLSSW